MNALERVNIANLSIAKPLYDLVRSEIAPGTGLDPDAVWTSLGAIVKDLGPENRHLLDVRARHEKGLDAWYENKETRETPFKFGEYGFKINDIHIQIFDGSYSAYNFVVRIILP